MKLFKKKRMANMAYKIIPPIVLLRFPCQPLAFIVKRLIYITIFLMQFGCKQPIYVLAYATDRDNTVDICIANTENTDILNLTDSDITEYNFTWSSDGSKIFYTSYEKTGRRINSIDLGSGAINTYLQDSTIL
ncbi:MAG: hypothetical protein WBN18_09875 [Flavobacteriaceae bacterium]